MTGTLNLFRAEWQKIIQNKWVVGLLVWVFPAGAVGVLGVMIIVALAFEPAIQQNMGLAGVNTTATWTEVMIYAWDVPNNLFGRFILLAFAAVVFAGEYQWGTWKNILPRSRRVPVLLIKLVTISAFVVVSFAAMSLIIGVGMAVPVNLAGGEYGPALTGEVVSDFARDYLVQASTAFIAVLISACYAALAAMITRSVLGSIMIGIGAVILESGILAGFALLGHLFQQPDLLQLFRLTPQYNIQNIVSWIYSDSGWVVDFFDTGTATANSLELSLLLLLTWVVGLVSVAAYLFRRQDIIT